MKPFQEYTNEYVTVTAYPHPDAIGGAIVEIKHGKHVVREEYRGIRGMDDALALLARYKA